MYVFGFSNRCCIFQVIWPYNTGEVIVQNYNAILSLAHLYQSADAIIALENDALQAVCTRLLAIPKVSFYNINRVIARQLASILAPVCAEKGGAVVRNQMGELFSYIEKYQCCNNFLSCFCTSSTYDINFAPYVSHVNIRCFIYSFSL